MANKTKKKWYGIRTIDGDKVNIYTENWQDCEAKIKGHNCEYKGFTTFEDCMNYLSDSKELKEFNENEKIEGLIAYTDGSWDKSGLFSWCSLFIKDDVIIDILYGAEVDTCTSRQIQGELMASTKAMEKAIGMKYKKMTIVHDYLGVAYFSSSLREWKGKTLIAREYTKTTERLEKLIEVDFRHVKGHSENIYNSLVDSGCKTALGTKLSDDINTSVLVVKNEAVKQKLIILGVEEDNIKIAN